MDIAYLDCFLAVGCGLNKVATNETEIAHHRLPSPEGETSLPLSVSQRSTS
jgi:hypothetical protein